MPSMQFNYNIEWKDDAHEERSRNLMQYQNLRSTSTVSLLLKVKFMFELVIFYYERRYKMKPN